MRERGRGVERGERGGDEDERASGVRRRGMAKKGRVKERKEREWESKRKREQEREIVFSRESKSLVKLQSFDFESKLLEIIECNIEFRRLHHDSTQYHIPIWIVALSCAQ